MKKYRLRMWVKVVCTLIIISLSIAIYHILAFYGSYAVKNIVANIFIQVGWFWLLFGQITLLYFIWEE